MKSLRRKSFTKRSRMDAMQNKLLEKDDDYRLSITKEEFNEDALTNIELVNRETAACVRRVSLAEPSTPASAVKLVTTSGRGIVHYCSLCKNAGIPENKYMSHSNTNCKDKEEMTKRAMSDSVDDRDKQVRKYASTQEGDEAQQNDE